MRQITFAPHFRGWQAMARTALAAGWEPGGVVWEELGADQPALPLFDEDSAQSGTPSAIRVPRAFVEMAQRVACHRDPVRWGLLYRVVWRLTHGEPHLLQVMVDPDVDALGRLDKAVRHDVHKMRAFVRFREIEHGGAAWFVAWFEPEHHIVEYNAPFFRDRFAGMRWSILTPDRCAHWDGRQLSFTAGVPKSEAPAGDAAEALWLTYYESIFNPARVKVDAMLAEMPKRYWKNLPEAAVIPALLQDASHRVEEMIARSQQNGESDAHPAPVPDTKDLSELRRAADGCTACPLYRNATQVVFGEGPRHAPLVLVGEQPGDQEDRQGHPFIGPAGQLLDKALAAAGIDRSKAYVTNAVKHFKWEPRGPRRLHKKPAAGEIKACRPWLAAELSIVKPQVLVLLGGTAAQSVLGAQVRVLRDRGRVMASDFCERTVVTVHPSSLLRAPDEEARDRGFAAFVEDLKTVAAFLKDR